MCNSWEVLSELASTPMKRRPPAAAVNVPIPPVFVVMVSVLPDKLQVPPVSGGDVFG